MVSELYKRTMYLNKNIEFIFGKEIIEYDIKSAGFNIIKKFKFLPEDKIRWLESLEKHSRHVQIGLLEKNNETLKNNLKKGFCACRKKLFVENDITDDMILSIKKDAIFIKGIRLRNTVFDNIEFVKKNVYESYFYLDKKEFYMNDDKCDCKGINDSLVPLHRPYMLDIFREFANLVRNSTHEKQLQFIKNVACAYRRRELSNGYYRELSKRSLFRPKSDILVLNSKMGYNFYEGDPSNLDISYNYTKFVVPMFRFLT